MCNYSLKLICVNYYFCPMSVFLCLCVWFLSFVRLSAGRSPSYFPTKSFAVAIAEWLTFSTPDFLPTAGYFQTLAMFSTSLH